MGFVDYDGVEPVVRQLGKTSVHGDGRNYLFSVFVVLVFVALRGGTSQRGIDALDGRNRHARLGVRLISLEALGDEDIREWSAVLSKAERGKLVKGLFAKVVAVNEK